MINWGINSSGSLQIFFLPGQEASFLKFLNTAIHLSDEGLRVVSMKCKLCTLLWLSNLYPVRDLAKNNRIRILFSDCPQ